MTTSSGDLDTVNRSQMVNKLSPSLDIGGGGRDVGAVVFGKAAFLEYTLGLFNGSGANKADTNDAKDLAGRLVVHPAGFLSLGASFYDGSYAASAGAASAVRDRFGLDLALFGGPFSLKADFISAEDGELLRRGWYVQGGCAFVPKTLQGIVKLDSYDPNASSAGDRQDTWTAGLNWFLTERTKLQVNYELIRNESGKKSAKPCSSNSRQATDETNRKSGGGHLPRSTSCRFRIRGPNRAQALVRDGHAFRRLGPLPDGGQMGRGI